MSDYLFGVSGSRCFVQFGGLFQRSSNLTGAKLP